MCSRYLADLSKDTSSPQAPLSATQDISSSWYE
jgi:RNA polymerase sigma-70 factor (ECF subfamily)